MTHVAILGYGEVGRSWGDVYRTSGVLVSARDLEIHDTSFEEADVLHVCLPFTDSMVTVVRVVAATLPALRMVLVSTTVLAGKTRALAAALPDHVAVAHVPVRGNHPDLAHGIRAFETYIGGVSETSAEVARKFLTNTVGLRCFVCRAEESELAKMACTTAYGVNIAMAFSIKRACDAAGLDPEIVYTRWTNEYNRAYALMGRPEVARPVLTLPSTPPYTIGGHCVVPNAVLIDQSYPGEMHECAALIAAYGAKEALEKR